jgi:hypothetical protein
MIKEIVNRHIKPFKVIKAYLKDVVCKKEFIITQSLFLFLSFFYSLSNDSISIDDLARDLYYGSDLQTISGYRWGTFLINRLLSFVDHVPFADDAIAIILMLSSSIVIGALLYMHEKEETINIWKYIIFISIYCTYPLINEIWEYPCINIYIYLGILLNCFSIIFINCNKKDYLSFIIAGIYISISFSSYESSIFVYVLLVLIHEFFEKADDNNYKIIKNGLLYVVPLFIAAIIKYLVGYILIKILGLNYIQNGATSIGWFTEEFSTCIKNIIRNVWYYVGRAFSYFPIGEFAIALIIYFIIIIKRKFYNHQNVLFIGILIVVSLFLLSIVQGGMLTYRTAQTIQVFVPFVAFLLFNFLLSKRTLLIILLLFVSFRQSLYLNKVLSLNVLRSENETSVIRQIGHELYSEHDTSKTIIFCGKYNLEEFIEKQISVDTDSINGQIENYIRKLTGHNERLYYDEYISTNVNSIINWCMVAFDGQSMFKEYFSYCGYNINVIENFDEDDEIILNRYEEIAIKENMKPQEIKEFDDYILVYFGSALDNVTY